MLSSTEKILSVVVLALTLAVGFSLMQYNSAMDEMTVLRGEQSEHVDMVNKEFKQRVKAVELENIGQGKEIKRGQDMILANTKLIYTKADSLGSLIDDLAYEIKRVDRDLSKKIKNVQRDLEGLEDNFDSEKRRTRRAISDIKKGLKNFKGVGRRFETDQISISNQPKILIDDYGHHPTEISVTIKAIKEKFTKKRILMIFEPHRYTRTKQLLQDFIKVLLKVDQLVLLDIYPASEKPMRGISSSRLTDEINQQKGNAINLSNNHAVEWITKNYKEFDILVTQGAGTISQLNNLIKDKWALKK